MTLIEVVILAGAQCLSPIQAAAGTTEVGKVPCAVLIRLDQETGDVEFTPPAAATDPQVIAMLVRPGQEKEAPVSDAGVSPAGEGDAQEVLPPAKPVPREKPATAGKAKQKPAKTAARSSRGEKTAAAAKKQRARKRQDSCGSYKAVWYTNKEGRRRYRCVRTG